jgi:hypothetical protein
MGRYADKPILEPVDTVLSDAFLSQALRELETRGFVTDEHKFAPYRETITHYVTEIEDALRRRGHQISLRPGCLRNHPDAGYAYFIYDTSRFTDLGVAKASVSHWLTEIYKNNEYA